MGAEVVEGKNPVEEGPNLADMEVHKNPSEEEDKNNHKRSELVQVNKEQQLGSSHLTQLPVHIEEPANAGVSAMLDKEQIRQLTIAKEDVREEPASQGVAEEETASKKLPLRKNKDKRSELVQVKKEKQLGSSHKTQLPAVAEEPKEGVREEQQAIVSVQCSTRKNSICWMLQRKRLPQNGMPPTVNLRTGSLFIVLQICLVLV